MSILKIPANVLLLTAALFISCNEEVLSPTEKEITEATVTDIDGNVYRTIKIGDQLWMAENLKVTRFRNGKPIAHVKDDGAWKGLSTSAYCYYQNEDSSDNNDVLYNWFAVNSPLELAPEGWHVASDDDWKELELSLGMGISDIDRTGFRGTDESGLLQDGDFGSLFGGYRGVDGKFSDKGNLGYWWTATEFCRLNAWNRGLATESAMVYRNFDSKIYGFSVRCVKD